MLLTSGSSDTLSSLLFVCNNYHHLVPPMAHFRISQQGKLPDFIYYSSSQTHFWTLHDCRTSNQFRPFHQKLHFCHRLTFFVHNKSGLVQCCFGSHWLSLYRQNEFFKIPYNTHSANYFLLSFQIHSGLELSLKVCIQYMVLCIFIWQKNIHIHISKIKIMFTLAAWIFESNCIQMNS